MRNVTKARILWITSVASLALAATVNGCSSSSKTNGNNPEDAGNELDGEPAASSSSGGAASSSGSSSGAASSSGSSSGGSTDAATEAGPSADAGDAGCTTLNVYNFDEWCSVSVNGAATSPNGLQTVCVPPGSITLVAEPKNGTFELGPDPWVYISGAGGTDSGTAGTIVGDGGVGSTSTTAVVVGSTPACVVVCCPFTGGTGCSTALSTANCL
jgi:hypothetical protein